MKVKKQVKRHARHFAAFDKALTDLRDYSKGLEKRIQLLEAVINSNKLIVLEPDAEPEKKPSRKKAKLSEAKAKTAA